MLFALGETKVEEAKTTKKSGENGKQHKPTLSLLPSKPLLIAWVIFMLGQLYYIFHTYYENYDEMGVDKSVWFVGIMILDVVDIILRVHECRTDKIWTSTEPDDTAEELLYWQGYALHRGVGSLWSIVLSIYNIVILGNANSDVGTCIIYIVSLKFISLFLTIIIPLFPKAVRPLPQFIKSNLFGKVLQINKMCLICLDTHTHDEKIKHGEYYFHTTCFDGNNGNGFETFLLGK